MDPGQDPTVGFFFRVDCTDTVNIWCTKQSSPYLFCSIFECGSFEHPEIVNFFIFSSVCQQRYRQWCGSSKEKWTCFLFHLLVDVQYMHTDKLCFETCRVKSKLTSKRYLSIPLASAGNDELDFPHRSLDKTVSANETIQLPFKEL